MSAQSLTNGSLSLDTLFVRGVSITGGPGPSPSQQQMSNLGAWDSNDSYVPQQVVQLSNYSYVALTSNSNAAPLQVNPGGDSNWTQLCPVGGGGGDMSNLGAWASNASYVPQNVVVGSGSYNYVALTSNSNASPPVGGDSNWQQLSPTIPPPGSNASPQYVLETPAAITLSNFIGQSNATTYQNLATLTVPGGGSGTANGLFGQAFITFSGSQNSAFSVPIPFELFLSDVSAAEPTNLYQNEANLVGNTPVSGGYGTSGGLTYVVPNAGASNITDLYIVGKWTVPAGQPAAVIGGTGNPNNTSIVATINVGQYNTIV